MMPVLFRANSTNFNTNGVGRIMPISCTVTEERNSIFELDMTAKIGCKHFEDIKQSAIVLAKPSPGRNPQPFRIYYVSRPINGKVKVKAEHLSYQLNYIPVMPFSTVNGVQNALNGFKANAAESCPFTFWTDISSSSSYAIAAPESIRHYLGGVRGSILDVFGGEYEWDVYSVRLHKSRGKVRDVTLRYGKNITDLRQEENIVNTFTGVCPYWQSTEGQLVTLPEKVIHSANAGNFPFQRTITKDFSDKFDNAPTEAQLRAYTQSYVELFGVGIPSVSIDVSFIDLAQTEEYKDLFSLQEVELCDTIKVEFPELGVSTTEKITKTIYDVLAERYTKIGVGDVRSSLAKTIEEQIDTVSYMPTASEVQRGIDRATGVLNQGKMGHMAINRNSEGYGNELLFLDEQSGGNLYTARQILRINMAGIGFSSTGYQGPYSQSWDLLGHLTLGGINNSYGDLTILDENAVPVIQISKNGFVLWNISAKGYMHNGVLYSDADLTTLITPTEGYYYYDVVERAVYVWDGSAYTAQTGNGGIYAKMTHDGLGVYHGVIDFSWGENSVGFYADGEKVRIGDFICDSASYGRAIFQTLDETTGMSADPGNSDGLYMWAAYNSDDDYVLAVNAGGIFTKYDVNIQGTSVLAAINEIRSKVSAYSDDSDDPYDEPTETPTGSADNEEAFTAEGDVFDDTHEDEGGSE